MNQDDPQAGTDAIKVIAKQVKRLRTAAGLSQEAMADRCGIYRTYLSRIEGGTANPTVKVLEALATTLDVPITELFVE